MKRLLSVARHAHWNRVLIASLLSLTFLLTACGGNTTKSTTATTKASPASADSSESENTDGTTPDATTGTVADVDRNLYEMDLTLDPENKSIGGTVTVTILNDSGFDWPDLCFRDYPSLFLTDPNTGEETDGKVSEISSLTDIATGEVLAIERSEKDASIITVPLTEPFKAGEVRAYTFTFTSYVPTIGDRFGNSEGVFNLSNFYPVLAVYEEDGWVAQPYFAYGECFYSVTADYQVKIAAPEDMTVISSGDETKGEAGAWTIEAELVRDIAIVVGSGFSVKTGEVGGVAVNCYYLTEDTTWGDVALTAASTSITSFEETFGEYPYPEVDVVQTYLAAAGMEYPSLIMITTYLGTSPDPDGSLSVVIAHELAHQWFYGMVGNDQYAEAWLDESLASYAEFVYMNSYLEPAVVAERAQQMEDSMKTEGMPMARADFRLNAAYNEFEGDYDYVYSAYYCGKVFIYRLWQQMGDEAFDTMIKEYVATYTNKIATTQDFVDIVKKHAPDNAEVNTILDLYLDAEI